MRRLSPTVCLLAALLGCSRGGPETHHVSGTITYQGQPLAGAQVGFVPDGSQADLKGARGQTDEQGGYTLKTYVKPGQENGGAMAGSYKVTVTKGVAQDRVVDYAELAEQPDALPAAYADAKQTPLSATVTADGENKFDFTVKLPEEAAK